MGKHGGGDDRGGSCGPGASAREPINCGGRTSATLNMLIIGRIVAVALIPKSTGTHRAEGAPKEVPGCGGS